jgi:hypothetical protein
MKDSCYVLYIYIAREHKTHHITEFGGQVLEEYSETSEKWGRAMGREHVAAGALVAETHEARLVCRLHARSSHQHFEITSRCC